MKQTVLIFLVSVVSLFSATAQINPVGNLTSNVTMILEITIFSLNGTNQHYLMMN